MSRHGAAADALARLMRALPKEKISGDTFVEYAKALQDVDEDLLEHAVDVVIRSRTSPWFPTVGEIRQVCAELWLDLPTEAGALAQVEARIQWGRERAGSPPAVHPVVLAALGQVGGYAALRESEDPSATRGRFGKVYRELRADAVRETAASDVWPKLLDA